jgi:Domain of unknown function (DUF6321)/Protein of unknown function (DUF5661)
VDDMKKRVPTEKEIAKKHGVDVSYVIRQAEIGSTVEREHVTDHKAAYGIALQHIDEFPDYYKHLLKMEKKLKSEWKNGKKSVKEETEEVRYCHLCAKDETKGECRYGPEAWEMATRLKIEEDHKEVASGAKLDDEGYMANLELDQMQRSIEILRKVIRKPNQQLPAWVQSKITRAADFIDTAADYLASDEKISEDITYSQFKELMEGASWTRKEGQNKNGGLNEKGRKSYERANPGSDLKAPSKKVGNPRRASFCARMKGMKSKLTSKKTASDPDSRINKSLRAWNC